MVAVSCHNLFSKRLDFVSLCLLGFEGLWFGLYLSETIDDYFAGMNSKTGIAVVDIDSFAISYDFVFEFFHKKYFTLLDSILYFGHLCFYFLK